MNGGPAWLKAESVKLKFKKIGAVVTARVSRGKESPNRHIRRDGGRLGCPTSTLSNATTGIIFTFRRL